MPSISSSAHNSRPAARSLNYSRPRVWGWWPETPAKLSLSTGGLAKTRDAARRDEAERGPNVEFLLQAFGFQLLPTTQRPAPNRPPQTLNERTAGSFPSCPLAEPGVEIMAQTDAGRSPPLDPLPHSQFIFDALPLGRNGDIAAVQKVLPSRAGARTKTSKGQARALLSDVFFWIAFLSLLELDPRVDDAHPPATLDFLDT